MIRRIPAFRRPFAPSRSGRCEPRSRRKTLSFEPLEDRMVPAIVGTLSLVGSTLRYSGTGAGNVVTIWGSDRTLYINDQAGEIDIVGVPGFDGDNKNTVSGVIPSSVLVIDVLGNAGTDTIRVGSAGLKTTRNVRLAAETITTISGGVLTAPGLILASTGGPGIGTPSVPLRINATSLWASASGTGSVRVLDTGGGLNVYSASTVAGDIGIEARYGKLYVGGKIEAKSRGNISLSASPPAGLPLQLTSPILTAAAPSTSSTELASPTFAATTFAVAAVATASGFTCPETGILDINADVRTPSGNIKLETYEGGTASNVENIVIRTVTVTTSLGNIDIRSADNLNVIGSTIDASGTLSTSGNVRIRGDYKSNDNTGSIVKLNGLVTGQAVEIRTGDGSGGAGADNLFVGSNVRTKLAGSAINIYAGLSAGDLNDRITFEGIVLPVANATVCKTYDWGAGRKFQAWYFEFKP
jgi:hypothetical protein